MNFLSEKENLEEKLLVGSKQLNLELEPSIREKLLLYLSLLVKWNKVYNLTAVRDPNDMLVQHILDSLTVVHMLENHRKILDVGAGAGLPGIVLAIMLPEAHVSMIDSVGKKTAFLAQVSAELRLKNTHIQTGRVEKWVPENKFDAIISRAFSSLKDFVACSGHLLDETGSYYAMKGLLPEEEIKHLPSIWTVRQVEKLKVPFLEAERHMVIIKRQESHQH